MSSLPLEGRGSGWGGRSRKQPNGHRCPVGQDSRRPSRRSAAHLPLVPPTLTLPLRGGGNLHHASPGERELIPTPVCQSASGVTGEGTSFTGGGGNFRPARAR